MKVLSYRWYKIPVGIRRFLGVLILFILAYWTFTFSVKLSCYLLYAGTEIIDGFFKFLVDWGGRMKLTDLHELLGKEIEKLADDTEKNAFDIDKANAISNMAKQIINNAQVIIRAEKQNVKTEII